MDTVNLQLHMEQSPLKEKSKGWLSGHYTSANEALAG